MAETKRPDPPGYAPPPGHVWAPIPEAAGDWKLQAGRACRASASPRRRACGAPSVAALNRRRYRGRSAGYADSWWAYCAEHLSDYRRWVEDGVLMRWTAVPEHGGDR
jgi:hypothetical protein